MIQWKYGNPTDESSIHLAVEVVVEQQWGYLARQVIDDGGRVLGHELPDGVRFSQIFSDVSLTASSRFHV